MVISSSTIYNNLDFQVIQEHKLVSSTETKKLKFEQIQIYSNLKQGSE